VLVLATGAAVTAAIVHAEPAQQESTDLLETARQNSAKVQQEIEAGRKAFEDSQKVALKRPTDGPLQALMVGDSLTAGYYSSVQEKGFSQTVITELEKGGPVKRLGGSQAGGNLSTVGGLVDVPKGFNLAVIELGTNDIQGKTDRNIFPGQYEGLLNKVREASPDAALVCMGTWGSAGADTDAYDAAIEKSCISHGGKYIDLSAEFSNPGTRGPAGLPSWAGTSDTFHPNDTGHARLANLVMQHLKVS